MARPGAIALGVYLAALAVFLGFAAVPFVDKKRDIPAEVPSPPALRTTDLVVLRPNQNLCMTDVALSAQARQMRFDVGTFFRPGPALRVTVRAPGYSARAAVRGGYADNTTVTVPVPPPRSSRLATVCVRNSGRRRFALYAASDSARSRVQPFVDGKPQPATPALRFDEAHPVSFADRAGVTAGRIAVFRGFLDHSWIVWALVVLLVVGVPILMLGALVVGGPQLRSDSSAE
jgi:hypothetical protein